MVGGIVVYWPEFGGIVVYDGGTVVVGAGAGGIVVVGGGIGIFPPLYTDNFLIKQLKNTYDDYGVK